MTKQEAYQEMLKGKKVRHPYYSSDEWVTIVDGEIQTEDGYRHGGETDEFWAIHQKWPDGWRFYEVPNCISMGSYLKSNSVNYDYLDEMAQKRSDEFHKWKLRKRRETDWAYIENIKEKNSEYYGKLISGYAKEIIDSDIDQAQKHVEYNKIEGALNETYCYLKSRLRLLKHFLDQTNEKP